MNGRYMRWGLCATLLGCLCLAALNPTIRGLAHPRYSTAHMVAQDPSLAALVTTDPRWAELIGTWHWQMLDRLSETYEGSIWKKHDIRRPQPPRAALGSVASVPPPNGATVLFDGHGLDQWTGPDKAEWRVEDGLLRPGGRHANLLMTVPVFGDMHIHLEWVPPANPPEKTGQTRGNSGVFLMGRYEVQILDSADSVTYADGLAGALYGQHPPRFNAVRPGGGLQIMDIYFWRPMFDDGRLVSPAIVSVVLNGVVVQNRTAFLGPTTYMKASPYEAHHDHLPFAIQDHGNESDRLGFSLIWVAPLTDMPDFSAALSPTG